MTFPDFCSFPRETNIPLQTQKVQGLFTFSAPRNRNRKTLKLFFLFNQWLNIRSFGRREIETGIIKYNNLGKVFVTGYFNSRTSDSIDYSIFDKYLDQNLQFLNSVDIPLRKSQDRITNYNGLKLLN